MKQLLLRFISIDSSIIRKSISPVWVKIMCMCVGAGAGSLWQTYSSFNFAVILKLL